MENNCDTSGSAAITMGFGGGAFRDLTVPENNGTQTTMVSTFGTGSVLVIQNCSCFDENTFATHPLATVTGTGEIFSDQPANSFVISSGTWDIYTEGYRNIPQNSRSAAYTTVLGDSGKHIYHPSADTTARTFTIDSNANVAYPIGTAITFVNDTSAGVVTIAITSDTLVLAGPGSTGSRTRGQRRGDRAQDDVNALDNQQDGAELMSAIQQSLGAFNLITVGSNSGIMWGVNGHPAHSGTPYTTVSLATQVSLISSLGVTVYRADFDNNDTPHFTLLTDLISAGAKMVPLLNPDPLSASYNSESAAYTFGHAFALSYATNYPTISIWELGNEYEIRIGSVSGQGSFITDYNSTNVAKVRGLVSGMIDGIRAGNPSAKVAFGSAGGGGHGQPAPGLWLMGGGYPVEHFYSDGGTVDIRHLFLIVGETDKLALLRDHYGKPIWMTEFSYWNTASSAPANPRWAVIWRPRWRSTTASPRRTTWRVYSSTNCSMSPLSAAARARSVL